VGYKRKLYTLKWGEDHELHGLEVTTKGLSIEKLVELMKLAASIPAEKDVETAAATGGRLFGEFAKRLVAWNLEEDDGAPVPATAEGVADQDFDFMLGVVTAWMDAVASVDTPLPKSSPNGRAQAPEVSLPMEPLSPSLPN
jgi:hypothetical protein